MSEITDAAHAATIGPAEREPLGKRIINSYRDIVTKCMHSVPFWLALVILLVSAFYLFAVGYSAFLEELIYPFTVNIILVLITIPLTTGREPAPWQASATQRGERVRLWFQIGLSLLCVLMVNYLALALRGAVPLPTGLLVIGPFFALLQHPGSLSKGDVSTSAILIVLVLEVVVPLVLTLLLGARLRTLGFCRGYRSVLIGLIGGATAIITGLAALVLSKIGILSLLSLYIQSFLIAGLTEELLFRGIFMTRFTRLFNPAWGIVLSGLLFGVAHFSNFLPQLHFDVMATLTLVILHNGFGGLVAGFIFFRTRNLLATTLWHGFNDAEDTFHSLLHLPF